jgi:hypothetical protein
MTFLSVLDVFPLFERRVGKDDVTRGFDEFVEMTVDGQRRVNPQAALSPRRLQFFNLGLKHSQSRRNACGREVLLPKRPDGEDRVVQLNFSLTLCPFRDW